jgi:hypothetical protein
MYEYQFNEDMVRVKGEELRREAQQRQLGRLARQGQPRRSKESVVHAVQLLINVLR